MKKPHISQFKEGPKTRIGKWAFWLSMVTILSGPILGVSAAVIVPFIDDKLSENISIAIGASVVIAVVLIFISAFILSIIAFFKKKERSWAVWLALVLSSLEVCFWTLMILGEFLSPH